MTHVVREFLQGLGYRPYSAPDDMPPAPGSAVFADPAPPTAPGLPASVPVPGTGADGRPALPDPADGRYCAKCAHSVGSAPTVYCRHPSIQRVDPVSGETVGRTAAGMRTLNQPCGPEGRLFKA